ncbi:MAG: hypothetical protein ACREP9_21425 [Candidatus Dormibacteraceae bacterium]
MPRIPVIMDGVAMLDDVLQRARYASIVAAVAQHTVFLHPDTVAQTHNKAVFPVIRNASRRGQLLTLSGGRKVMLDDNTSPTFAFLCAAGRGNGRDIQ